MSIQKRVPASPIRNDTPTGQQCPSDQFFAFSEWGSEEPFSAQFSAVRRDLTGEFDRFDEAAVTRLARLYLHFGFGREAQQALALDGAQSQDRRYLTALARVLDNDTLDGSIFAEQVGCESDVALWAFLAHDEGPKDAVVAVNAILKAFGKLPHHLQDMLSARLSQKFLAMDDQDSAMKVLNMHSGDGAAELASAEAALLEGLGEKEEAGARYANIVRQDHRAPPETLVAMFDAGVKKDVALTSDDFILGDAMQFELAGDPSATDIAIAQVHAHLSQGDFRGAAQLIARIAAQLEEEASAKLHESYAVAAVEDMTDPAFLEFAFGNSQSGLSDSTRRDIAARLALLGFEPSPSDVTGNFLEKTENSTQMVNDTTTDIDPSLFDDTGTTDVEGVDQTAVDATLWRTSDWPALSTSNDAVLRSAADLAISPEISELDPDQPLASGREMLSQSSETRQVVEDILKRFSAPAGVP